MLIVMKDHRPKLILVALLVVVALAAGAASSGADAGDGATGSVERGGGSGLRLVVRNTGTTTLTLLNFALPSGFTPTDVILPGGRCAPDSPPNTFSCFGFNLTPGASLTVTFITNPGPVPDGSTFTLSVSSTGNSDYTTSVMGPVTPCIPPGSAFTKCADLDAGRAPVLLDALYQESRVALLIDDVTAGDLLYVSGAIANHGPDDACAQLAIKSPALTEISHVFEPSVARCLSGFALKSRTDAVYYTLQAFVDEPGGLTGGNTTATVEITALNASDPVPANNTTYPTSFKVRPRAHDAPVIKQVGVESVLGDLGHVVFPASGDTAGLAAARSPAAITRVEVAILNLSRPKQCRWVKGLKIGFTPERATTACDRPVWLRAQGTKHWKLQLKRPLPRGRYVVLARAIDANGNHSSVFSGKGRTQARLTVRS
jgi:hypothetical protein